jgi:hypothetical protein
MAARKPKNNRKHGDSAEMGHVPISDTIIHRPLSEIRPSPENDKLYRLVDTNDPDFLAFVEQVRINGITDPLVTTIDGFIVSGHRRYAAAKYLGMDSVPCRTANIHHTDPRFLTLLRDCNRQRVKTLDEVLREEVVSANPEESYRLLLEHRRQQAAVDDVDTIELGAVKRRARITAAKRPFLDAILRILREYRDSWPLSVRQIHYYLLNDPPLIHAGKPGSTYRNDIKSYKMADELTVRARLTREIAMNAIHDATRPVVTWNVFDNPAPFIKEQLNEFLKGYYRNLMQSQPNHIEIIGEKNTIAGAIQPVAMEYTIPYTIGRGYSSLPPRHDMAVRFRRSGKEKLILLVLSDFDPEGEDIGRAFAQSMRDDFGITNIVPIKVALTGLQVDELNLPPMMTAKKTSSRRAGFVRKHGEHVFELESIPPAPLQQLLRDGINDAIDVDAFNAEIDREMRDAAFLDTVRRRAHEMLGDLGTHM